MSPTKLILNNNEIIMKEILPRKGFFFLSKFFRSDKLREIEN